MLGGTGHSGGHKGDKGSRPLFLIVFIRTVIYLMIKGQVLNAATDDTINQCAVVGDTGNDGCGTVRFLTDHIPVKILNVTVPLRRRGTIGKVQIRSNLESLPEYQFVGCLLISKNFDTLSIVTTSEL